MSKVHDKSTRNGSSRLERSFRIATQTGHQFSPTGPKLTAGDIQTAYLTHKDAIITAISAISAPKFGFVVKLGPRPMLKREEGVVMAIMDVQRIHPKFVAAALTTILNRAGRLRLAQTDRFIQLSRLCYKKLEAALKDPSPDRVKAEEIGPDFEAFRQLNPDRQIAILVKLGVIKLPPGSVLT